MQTDGQTWRWCQPGIDCWHASASQARLRHRPRPLPPLPPSPRGRNQPRTRPVAKHAAPVTANECTTCGGVMGDGAAGPVGTNTGAANDCGSICSDSARDGSTGGGGAGTSPRCRHAAHGQGLASRARLTAASLACLLLDLVHLLIDGRLQALCTTKLAEAQTYRSMSARHPIKCGSKCRALPCQMHNT